MRRAILLGAALLVAAGCGNRQRTISESAVVDAVHGAGFTDVHRLTGPKAPSPSAFEAAEGVARDLFYVGPFRSDGRFPIAVLWTPSQAHATADRRARLHQVPVCNVVVSSYGDRRFDRVVALLRKDCG